MIADAAEGGYSVYDQLCGTPYPRNNFMDPNTLTVLLARGENASLDFKEMLKTGDKRGKYEFCKDIMAMANSLSPNSSPAYIVVGARENQDGDAEIVGVNSADVLDEASYQQIVSGKLNRPPNFTMHSLEVDGKQVVVFEIRPGKRPFYPIKTVQDGGVKLVKNIARYRTGSSTADADPDLIQNWYKEDDFISAELKRLELKSIQADLRPTAKGRLSSNSRGRNKCTLELNLANWGPRAFTVLEGASTVRFQPDTAPADVDLAARVRTAMAAVVGPEIPHLPELLGPGEHLERRRFDLQIESLQEVIQLMGAELIQPEFIWEQLEVEVSLKLEGQTGVLHTEKVVGKTN